MPRRTAPEVRITEYFSTAPLEVAKAIFEVVKATLKLRTEAEAPAKPVRRRNRRPSRGNGPMLDTKGGPLDGGLDGVL